MLGLTIIHVIKSAIAAYYHLRVIVYMCMRDERYERPVSRIPAGSDVGLAISAIAMIYLDVLLG